MRIAVIGSRGQLGSEILRAAANASVKALGFDHSEVEVTDQTSVERALSPLEPGDVVVNTAAFHRTDACEDQPDRALSVNAVGALRIAVEAHRKQAAVVYLSSDFVFDGNKRSPYVESDAPHPLNVYGMSKLAGEVLVSSATPRHYIIRIASVFGIAGSSGKGGNFVESMIAKARAGETPRVVNDIIMTPTAATDAANLLVEIVNQRAPFGTYHLANAGQCTWFEFANAIFELLGLRVRATPITAAESGAKAPRPRYSALASEELPKLGLAARPWRDALSDYLASRVVRADQMDSNPA